MVQKFSPQHNHILMGFLSSQLQTPQAVAQECQRSSVTATGSFPVQRLPQVCAVDLSITWWINLFEAETGTL